MSRMTTSPTVFDVIVVGAGVEGSATAYQLIKHGAKRVLLLEQVKIDI
jgi:glycine/D-amino acid oxidase-like deaminating enzyme